MTKNKRFTRSNTQGWQKTAFLEVLNGLDEKNKKLKEENEQLKSTIMEMEDYLGRLEEQIKGV